MPRLRPALVLVLAAALAAPAQGQIGAATPKRVVIPWIVGRQQVSAAARLHAFGLRVRVVRVRSLKAVGKVVAERPRAGTKVARGTRVTIAVSRGPGPAR